MDNQIANAKEEALSRRDILDKVEKWMSACEEESWLEDYNRVFIVSLWIYMVQPLESGQTGSIMLSAIQHSTTRSK
jgi:hypothetical protein